MQQKKTISKNEKTANIFTEISINYLTRRKEYAIIRYHQNTRKHNTKHERKRKDENNYLQIA